MRTFSKVLAVVLCVAMLFTTAFASGLNVSFVDFQANGNNITARVNLRNDDSANALSGKIIVASYDKNGNLVATGESDKVDVAKGAETIVSASVASGADSYKAFVWNDSVNANSVHAVAGATAKTDFVADTGVDNAFVSAKEVATTGMTGSKPELELYSPFKGRTEGDESEATGGRVTVSNFPANSLQYHEVYYADPSLVGLDFFVFSAGTIDYFANGSPLLTFDIVRDSEIMILTTNDALEFEGFDLVKAEDAAANGSSFAESRYMTREFADALNAIGIRPTYAMAKAYDADEEGYYEAVLKTTYDAASDSAKATFDTNWTKLKYSYFKDNEISDKIEGTDYEVLHKVNVKLDANGEKKKASNSKAYTNPGNYTAMYTKTVTLDGAESAEVVIPASEEDYVKNPDGSFKVNEKGEKTPLKSRNLIVLVKPVADMDTSDAFVPLTSAGNINAAPALKGVEIDGAYVGIDKFTDNEYTYLLNPLSDCVLPVIKGVTTDNALYATTDYDIASDAKTAVATVTVKNLYKGTSTVYTINIAIGNAPADAYDIVNLNGTTIVDNTNVLARKTVTEGIDGSDCPIDTPVAVVRDMTYAQYIAYINEYYGYKEGDAEYITGTGVVRDTDVVKTADYFNFAKDFEVGGRVGVETSGNRTIVAINPEFAFYRNLYRFYGHISYQQLGGHGFYGGLWYGEDSVYGDVYNANAGTDKLPPVPWFTAVMKETGTVYVNSYTALPHLAERGYELYSTGIAPYTSSALTTPTYVYRKVFKKGETVEIFNDNSRSVGHPSSWFFTTAVPDTYSYEYGKKSSAAAATSYNSTLTNGVLYKDLFADIASSRDTSGGQWTSDFQPLGSGQRIKSVEDPSLLGCDYFGFSIGNRTKMGFFPGTNILEFKVDKDCDVLILTKSQDSGANFGDFTKNTSAPSLTAMFPQSNYFEAIKALGIPTTDISMDMVADFYPSSGLTFKQLYDKWLSAEFPGATEEELLNAVNVAIRKQATLKSLLDAISTDTQFFASVDSKAAAIGGGHVIHPYTVTHTKEFKAGDTVAIPDPTDGIRYDNKGNVASFDRPIMVVVKPKLATTITDHVTDFRIVAEDGAGTFILGPGTGDAKSGSGEIGYQSRLSHDYVTTTVEKYPHGAYTQLSSSPYAANYQRVFGITDEVIGLENCYYLRMLNVALPESWAGGNGADDLPWMTFKVNQDCDIIIIPSGETPNFVKDNNQWVNCKLTEKPFTLSRHQVDGTYKDCSANAKTDMYIKSFEAGQTVTLYNTNTGKAGSHNDYPPYFAFVRVK